MKRFLLMLGILLLAGNSLAQETKKPNAFESIQLFQTVLNHVQSQYWRKAEVPDLIKSAIDGMLNALDPYSEYMEPKEAEDLRVRTQGEFGGIGIHIGMQDGHLTVMSTIEGTPAYRQGLMAGDQFVEIEGKNAQGMTIQDAVSVLRGDPGTNVSIKMRRFGVRDLMPYTITREVIKIKAVPYAGKVGEDIGYVRLADFSQSAQRELSAALDSLVNRVGVSKLIFDLRQNGGGLLQEGHEVSELFLPAGSTTVTTAGQTPSSKREFTAANPNSYVKQPMVLLVDRGSASAAEIVSGALQDYERAVIVGETTFGKGTVQSPIPMPSKATLKLTTALWYTPSGRCVDVRTGRDTMSKKQDTMFQTLGKNRRPIRGWSGIVPDVYLPYPRTSEFEAKLRADWFFEFSVQYAAKHPDLKRDFSITPEIMNEFEALLKEKRLEFTAAQIDSARSMIERGLRVNLATRLWGTYGEYEARLPSDEQVRKAIELLKDAKTEQDVFDKLGKQAGNKK